MLSLLRLERKRKNSSNPFRILIFFFLSYSFGIETPSKSIPDSRPKWPKCIPVFTPKRRKNPTRWGGTYLYSLYKGVPPGFQRLPRRHYRCTWSIKMSCAVLKGLRYCAHLWVRSWYRFIWLVYRTQVCFRWLCIWFTMIKVLNKVFTVRSPQKKGRSEFTAKTWIRI